ncbi:MAG TPA: ATP-binding protein, partial [Chlamydiales bacterium]|nr:ATP-binding protein [Chlamydiales bacterium]
YFENILIDQAEKLERIAQETDGWSHSQFKELLNTFKSGDDIEKSVQKQNLEIKKKQILAKLAAQARLGILPKTLSEEKDGPGVFLEPSNVAFTDIAGNEAAKDKFAQIIQYFTNFEIYKAVMNSETDNVNCLAPKGVILYGPPGTGKTKLIEALANEIKFPVLSVKGSLQNKYIGESAENIRRIFKQAKSVGGPCILFIDEIDSMGKRSGGAEDASANAVTQMINTFLAETNELEKWPYPIIIIGATNRIEAIDDALKRPGRFDALIEVCLPDATTREAILKIHAQKFNLSPDLNFQAIAEHTSNFSGAHLEELVKTAARCAIDDRCARLKAIQTDTSDIPTKVVIEQGHLETALKTVRPKQETKPAEDADALMNVLRDALLLSSK